MIRSALELAWAVAKAGSQARPPIAPPGRLRPLMRFARLPDRALATVRQVLEDDPEFRARVAAAAESAGLEGASRLWLLRPDGWSAELDSFTEAADVAAQEVQAEREERHALRRLAAAESSAARTEVEMARLQEANAELQAEIAAERQSRRRSEIDREDMEAGRRSAEAKLASLTETVDQMRARIAALAGAVDEDDRRLSSLRNERDAARGEADLLRSQRDEAEEEAARAAESQERIRVSIATAVARAAAGARELTESLVEVARLLSPGPGEYEAPADDEAESAGPPLTLARNVAHVAPGGALTLRPAEPDRRHPVSLPPAVFDDSFEAGEYLVRVEGMQLIVDGYNVTISSWPHLELPQQRQRLVDALAELAMRTGISVDVVFDGLDAGGRIRPPSAARHQVSVTFSPEGVEADEVIVDLVDELDSSQPVLVATDDRRVRDEVSERGANVISVVQLLAVLGRLPGGAADRGSAAR
jgi:predicted RNA-binding protein with PIN domain